MSFWKTVRDEVREVLWLASVVGGLSVIGITLAVMVGVVLHT
jgi:hypothetical protein